MVVGGGGREHAIVWKLAQSPRVSRLYCAPGNSGIAGVAECIPIKATDIKTMADFARKEGIDLTFVAPDDPLALGMVDEFEGRGLRVFGPRANAAVIESSKAFSKAFMQRHNIPTAAYRVFDDYAVTSDYICQQTCPIVIKADGLALGKGVIIAQTQQEAQQALRSMMVDSVFGDAGRQVVIEEFLTGPEVTVLAFTDGKTVVPMVSSQDHKRVYDDNKGPNTGGMGTFSPSRFYTAEHARTAYDTIFMPTIQAMAAEGRVFKGVIYFGLMLTPQGPKVIEYNARFGDPETQVVLPRLKTDFMDIIDAVIDERLDKLKIEWTDEAAVCVVLASGGYPGKYQTGLPIEGLAEAEAAGAVVFHAGTKYENGNYYTSGGRVLGVTATGRDLGEARGKAYAAADKIRFEGMHMRRDIAK